MARMAPCRRPEHAASSEPSPILRRAASPSLLPRSSVDASHAYPSAVLDRAYPSSSEGLLVGPGRTVSGENLAAMQMANEELRARNAALLQRNQNQEEEIWRIKSAARALHPSEQIAACAWPRATVGLAPTPRVTRTHPRTRLAPQTQVVQQICRAQQSAAKQSRAPCGSFWTLPCREQPVPALMLAVGTRKR